MENFKIYKHTNLLNEKVYIGQTKQRVGARRSQGYKHNKHFSSAIKKYGWENFDTTVLESNLNQKQADTLETSYIISYEATNREKGYNKTLGGEHPTISNESRKIRGARLRKLAIARRGIPLSEEHKRKISESRKGKCVGGEHPNYKRVLPAEELERLRKANLGRLSGVNREIIQLDLNSEFIKEWNSAKKAGESLNIDISTITKCCRGKRKTAGNFKWRYKKSD